MLTDANISRAIHNYIHHAPKDTTKKPLERNEIIDLALRLHERWFTTELKAKVWIDVRRLRQFLKFCGNGTYSEYDILKNNQVVSINELSWLSIKYLIDYYHYERPA